jgi:hypothetical protein
MWSRTGACTALRPYEVDNGKAPFIGDRAHHFVHQDNTGRARGKRRVIAGKDNAQALAETRTIPECDRLSAIKQEVTPQRAALGMLAELCPEGRGVRESEAEQAVLISLHRQCPREFVKMRSFIGCGIALQLDGATARGEVSPQLALDFVAVGPAGAADTDQKIRRTR